jgi:hypothetical protein
MNLKGIPLSERRQFQKFTEFPTYMTFSKRQKPMVMKERSIDIRVSWARREIA